MRQMFLRFAFCALTFGAAVGAATAQNGPSADMAPLVVVELYTSQGCSSCPPADDLMTELVEVEGVLPLSLHVDYWDYIGWKDAFAQPKFTDRQRAYANMAGKRMIYTPQMIVHGQAHVVGHKPMKLADEIARAQAAAPASPVVNVTQTSDPSGAQPTVTLASDQVFEAPLLVQVVTFIPHARVDIGRGENAGRSIDYSNIVTRWEQVAQWDGRAPLPVSIAVPEGQSAALIVQSEGPGAVVSAYRVTR